MSSRIWSLSQEISPKSFLVCGLFDISFFNCSTKKLTSIKHMWNKGTVFKSHHQCVRDRDLCVAVIPSCYLRMCARKKQTLFYSLLSSVPAPSSLGIFLYFQDLTWPCVTILLHAEPGHSVFFPSFDKAS